MSTNMCQNCQGTMVFLFTMFWGIAHSGITSVIQSWNICKQKHLVLFKQSKGWGHQPPHVEPPSIT